MIGLLILFWLMRLAVLFGALALAHRVGTRGSRRQAVIAAGLGLLVLGYAAYAVENRLITARCGTDAPCRAQLGDD